LEATEPTGNLIVLNEERKIEETARHVPPDVNQFRTILPGHIYVPPPNFEGPLPSELEKLDYEDLLQIKGIGRVLARKIGENWDQREPAAWLSMLRSVYTEEKMPNQRLPKGYITRFPFQFPEAEQLGEDSFLAAEAGVLRPLLTASRTRLLRELDARITRVIKSRERHVDGLLKQLENSAEADTFKRKGELLLANLHAVPPRAEIVTLRGWNSEGHEEMVKIELDPKLPPSRNAERYFKKYKKAHVDPLKIQEETAALKSAIEELKEQRELLDAIESPAQLEEAVRDVLDWLAPSGKANGAGKTDRLFKGQKSKKGKKGKKENDPPHARYEMDGYIILVGLSARGNRFVTFKLASGDDMWLHAHEMPSAHVIIKNVRDREELEGEKSHVLAFAASLAAAYSRGKEAVSVLVDYTERRYVRSVPGQAVALVTYTQPGTLRVNPRLWKEIKDAGNEKADKLNSILK